MPLPSTVIDKSTPQNFKLIFPKIPVVSKVIEMKELSLNIFDTIIPSLNLEFTDATWQSWKTLINTGQITFQPWTVSFIVDSNFKNWIIIYKWITSINNNKNIAGGDPKDYRSDATLQILDNYEKEILRIAFVDIWPTNLGEVTLTSRDGGEIQCTVEFIYDRYEVYRSDL